jgi:spore coat polysaccharide biosynthesis protein SpsF
VEVCSFKILAKAWKEAREPQHREHAMPYFYEGVELTTINRQLQTGISPRGYNIALLHHTTDFGDYRWTVDTPEDLEFVRQVYSRFDGRDDFSWKEVLDLVHNEPQLMQINADVKHKTLKDIDTRATKK